MGTVQSQLSVREDPRRKMKANSGAMTQSGVSKCLLHTLLSSLLLLNSWVAAGFISPGNSVSIGTSPTLRYLLACRHLPTKPPIFSTHDIYTNEQVAKGLRHLQAALGLPETGVEGEEERRLVKRGKCVNNTPNKEPVMSPQLGITFPGSSSVEIFKKTEDNSVNFEGVATRKPNVILPSSLAGNGRAGCQEGRLVRKCGKQTNQPCSWFCRNKKRTRQWS